MVLRWVVGSLHLLALPLGLSAVWARSRALDVVHRTQDVRRVFLADNLWGLAFVIWLTTGLLRVFAGLEKGTNYYLHDRVFYVKMGLLLAILLLEIWPMVTLIRWRIAAGRGTPVALAPAPTLARISRMQAGIVVLMVFAATALARGFFY